jgi:hypothetical protein
MHTGGTTTDLIHPVSLLCLRSWAKLLKKLIKALPEDWTGPQGKRSAF